jgi:hypothetical protein
MSGDNRHIGQRAVDEERLDSVIDTVARQMTEFEPSGALRARVLEQVQKRRRQSSPAVPRWAWASTAAAAAVVVAVAAAVWVVGPQRTREDGPSTVAELRPGEVSPAPALEARQAAEADPAAGQTPAATSRVAMVRPPGRGVAESAQPAEADAGDDLRRVPALAEIEPLRFDAVEPDPLQIEAVEMTPFPTIEPIDIPSLDKGPSDIQSVDSKKEKRP